MRGLLLEKPNAKQRQFFLAKQPFIAYGGARGGGKSWAVRKKALLLAVRYPNIRILLLRRSFPELRENHILPLLKDLKDIAVYKETEKAFNFPNGSRLKFGYCDTEADVLQYQGQEYDVIFIDEATQFSEYQFMTLTACLRGTGCLPKRMYLTCNPGGIGHAWVKRLFIDKIYYGSERAEDYLFIPAKVYDNEILLHSSPSYLHMLENLPAKLRRAWLDGDWNVFAGQYFSMWRQDVHVIKPFNLPHYWRRYVSLDYGRDMLAAYFIALDEAGRAYVYKEIYQSGLLVTEAAALIKERTNTDEVVSAYYAPPDLWNRHSDTGRSTAEIFASCGLPLLKVNNDRVQGWYELAEWLRIGLDKEGRERAGLMIWESCPNLIRTLPLLQYDDKNPNDCACSPHELTHAPDALRYFVSGRPQRTSKLSVNAPEDERPSYDKQVEAFLTYGCGQG